MNMCLTCEYELEKPYRKECKNCEGLNYKKKSSLKIEPLDPKAAEAVRLLFMAEEYLKKAAKNFAEFGSDVPAINDKATEHICSSLNHIDVYSAGIKSFVRISVLRKIIEPQKKEASA